MNDGADEYIAHIGEGKRQQTVKDHSEKTAALCETFAAVELKSFAYDMGLYHDVGKYQKGFQRRIRGENIRIEHSGCGAAVAFEKLKKDAAALAYLMAYCIAGHHSGIPDGGTLNDTSDMKTLNGRLKREFEDYGAYKSELSDKTVDISSLKDFLLRDCGNDMELFLDKYAFVVRYCFSCLVDADSIDTASFCHAGENPGQLVSDFKKCLEAVNKRLDSFAATTSLQSARALLQGRVFEKCGVTSEIYLMNMPTGSGKTLCGIKFALERAIRTSKKRIIYIIPYNSIINQTVNEFENTFGEYADILRHQSTFSYDDADYDEDYRKAALAAEENWDADTIIVTTAVQFFETVYSNKRGKLRKLHNMSDSVLIFDEAHLMPEDYLLPCLRAICCITRYLNSEAVFLTATMPNFHSLIERYSFPDMKISDLIEDDEKGRFDDFKKCRFEYSGDLSSETLVSIASQSPASLIVVNKKNTAREIYKFCGGVKFHLSTYMTSIDRDRVINDIKETLRLLENDFPDGQNVPEERHVTIVSTSLIEAGVDLDVYAVFRELAGLDSILQAGGRCNREGKRTGAVTHIFEFPDRKKTESAKINMTRGLIEKYDDISCPECVNEYYERLYFMNDERIREKSIGKDCLSIRSIPFEAYAENFEIIVSKEIPLIVPSDERCEELIEGIRSGRPENGFAGKLQKYACSVYQSELDNLIRQHAAEDCGGGVYCLTNPDYYDGNTGITFEPKDYFI
ncbi:MAG: CRISPR-associated helicase Cas3' [Firmicutes bacterium]|nr:CRISPR-associated helicase Cas3' [Bacillota bacterium]